MKNTRVGFVSVFLFCLGLVSYISAQGLEVAGAIKIVDGTQGMDKVLTSDADGFASWAASPVSPPPTYSIGDFAQGGVVFWVSANGEHGKVVSIYDVGIVLWSNLTGTLIGASAQSEINGAGNTVAIMMQSGHTSSAARHCADLAYGGHDDWYLPSKDELDDVYASKATINATALANGGELFANSFYWSSSEFDAGSAWGQFFSDGTPGDATKDDASRVRAIRAF